MPVENGLGKIITIVLAVPWDLDQLVLYEQLT